jgi:hypothetical protein
MEYEISTDEDRGSFISHARKRSAAKAERDPLVGDIVHHWNGRCYAAIVCDLTGSFDDPTVDLYSLHVDGGLGFSGCRHDEAKSESHTWHWPESE